MTARFLLGTAALSVLVPMGYAAVYAFGDFREDALVTIPEMARIHGVLNVFGFSLCGLLGWNLAMARSRAHHGAAKRQRVLPPCVFAIEDE